MQEVILFTHPETIVHNFVGWTLENYAPAADLIVSTDHVYSITKGVLLHAMAVVPTTDITLSVGTAPGIDDIQPPIKLKANEPFITTIGRYAAFEPINIYFTGIDTDALVKFFKL